MDGRNKPSLNKKSPLVDIKLNRDKKQNPQQMDVDMFVETGSNVVSNQLPPFYNDFDDDLDDTDWK